MSYLKDWQEIFRDPKVSIWDKIHILVGVVIFGFLGFIGLMYLTGVYEVESEPVEVETRENIPYSTCSELTGECYDVDPPDQWVDEFPSRP
jgi:hypothetical protein